MGRGRVEAGCPLLWAPNLTQTQTRTRTRTLAVAVALPLTLTLTAGALCIGRPRGCALRGQGIVRVALIRVRVRVGDNLSLTPVSLTQP